MATDSQQPLGKGKGRAESAEASERTPLLPSPSGTSQENLETTANARRSLRSKLTFVFLFSLSFCLVIFALLALLGYSYAAQVLSLTPEEILDRGLVWKGPDRLDVLNVTADGGIWVEVEGKVGFNAGAVVGVNGDDEDSVWKAAWKSIGRWGLRQVDNISIRLSTIRVSLKNDDHTALAAVKVAPQQISLSTNPPSDESWLTTISTPVLITPTQDSTTITQFIGDCWRDGSIDVEVSLRKALVHGGGLDDHSWRSSFSVERSDTRTPIHMRSKLYLSILFLG